MKIALHIAALLVFSITAAYAQNREMLFSPNGVAEVHIRLLNNKTINDIKNDNDEGYAGKLEADIDIRNSAYSGYASSQLHSGRILIEGRGYSTWSLPKKPYNIDLVTTGGDDETVPLLDMPACSEWCLLTSGFDGSLMRFPLAMFIGQRLQGIPWTPRTRYVELWINDEYLGLYCLTEKIKRDDNRIKIKKLDAASDNLSGGYILEENTKVFSPVELATQFFTERGGIPIIFKYPKPKNVTPAQATWIRNYLNEFESVLWSDYFKDAENGYRKYINIESFIDWTVLQEQAMDTDHANNLSNYLHKDRDGKLYMSAPWDFDRAYGNDWNRSPEGNLIRLKHWYGRLAEDQAYMEQYKARLGELKPLFGQIPGIIEENYGQLLQAGVLEREAERWRDAPSASMTGCSGYRAEADYLINWIQVRNEWCYNELGITSGIGGPETGDMFACYFSEGGNTLNIHYSATRSAGLKIQLYGMEGRCLKNAVADAYPGKNRIQLDTGSLNTGVYILYLHGENGTVSMKIIK